jgi:tRNA pseudouridine38-40 synthase
MDRHTYRIDLAYNGAGFAGFERQVGERTVESQLVAALSALVPDLPGVAAGGRTDRGVSATGQVISFWSRPRLALDAIASAIDRAAPDEIAVLDVREVSRSFHAQFSASSRRYVYLWTTGAPFDVPRVDRMLSALAGRRSFYAFARDTPKGKSCVRRLLEARARECAEGVRFDFHADGFVRHQIRILVATAIREASLDRDDDALVRLAVIEDRRGTEPAAPAAGLYLTRIGYDAR